MLITSYFSHLEKFSSRTAVLLALSGQEINNLSDQEKGQLRQLARYLSDSSTATEIKWVEDLILDAANTGELLPIYTVHEGESLDLAVNLEEGRDLTGKALTIRRADNKQNITGCVVMGDTSANKSIQRIPIRDCPLSAGSFYKVYLGAECVNDQGEPNGDVDIHLGTVILVVDQNIDISP